MVRYFLILAALVSVSGCMTMSRRPVQNPMAIRAPARPVVWEQAVGMLHDFHFQIARENELDGVIVSEYRVGSGLLEPWHPDSVGLSNRLEATLQPIRRRVFVNVTPIEGGYLLGIEAFKELEDLAGLAANSPGGATFRESTPLRRDLNLVVGQSTPSGWIAQGRDRLLEEAMLRRLRARLTRRPRRFGNQ